MPAAQRFCPVCDRLFQDGEAVLACSDCTILHHPACWVRNDGCAASNEHSRTPQPQAYNVPAVPGTPRAPTAATAAPSGPAVRQAGQRTGAAAPPPAARAPRPRVDGVAPAPRMANPQAEPPPGSTIKHGRYVPPPEEPSPVRKGMPAVYHGNNLLRFWYVPVGVLVAVGAAIATVWVAGAFFGGDDDGDDQQAAADTPAASTTTEPGTTAEATQQPSDQPTGESTPGNGSPTPETPAATATFAPTSGKYQIGQTLVVSGAGDCLNVRVGPARSNDAIICLEDGATVKVSGGPREADSYTWWLVETRLGEGWAVEDYLKPQ